MHRSLSVCRDLVLGREAPYSEFGCYQVEFFLKMPAADKAVLAGFSDDRWLSLKRWCLRTGLFWHKSDVSAPVHLLPEIASRVLEK